MQRSANSPLFDGLWDIPQDLVDCVLCFLMTVLMETHLIPNPHHNFFLSRMAVTHTERCNTSTFPRTHAQLPQSFLFYCLFKGKKSTCPGDNTVLMPHRLYFTELMRYRKWGSCCWALIQLLYDWRLVLFAVCINCHHTLQSMEKNVMVWAIIGVM